MSTVAMRAALAVSVMHLADGTIYRPNKKGDFDIAPQHVTEVRVHGLRTIEEIEQEEGAPKVKDLVAENAALRAQVAELQAKKK